MHDCVSSNKIKENKYKILRMSLLLGRGEDPEETLTNFEEAARDIDAMNDETYLKDLEGKFYDTLTLEEEEKKLAVLVDYIGGRVEQRISLLNDFSNVTGYDLTNLPMIKYYDKLDDYKERLKYIREYLSNTEEIGKLNQKIEEAETKLKEAYLSKATGEDYNARNEEILLNKFENILKTTDLKDINKDNIEEKLKETMLAVEDSKKSLDIFNKSFATLSGSGISYEEEQEYKSYVDNAKELYYTNKEHEYLLRIYQYLLKIETEYNVILEKRENINTLLQDRLSQRKELGIQENDILSNLYDLIERQFDDIKHQEDNISLIDRLNEDIEHYKSSLNDLELDNQKVEILALLREFCLIDTYSDTCHENGDSQIVGEKNTSEDLSLKDKEITLDKKVEEKVTKESVPSLNQNVNASDIFKQDVSLPEVKVEEVVPDEVKDNQVVAVENSTNIDLDYIHSKASKVMQRVGEMLGIKVKDTKVVSVSSDNNVKENDIFSSKEENKKDAITSEQPGLEKKESTSSVENPLFSSNEDLKNDIFVNSSSKVDPEDNDSNFWFASDTPDALNELPDLDIPDKKDNNTFFGNNQMPNLNFPDLNLNFAPNGEEEGK